MRDARIGRKTESAAPTALPGFILGDCLGGQDAKRTVQRSWWT